jgi:molybdopterin synthase sulfur carrier subunit
MAIVLLRAPLKDLAGGKSEVRIDEDSVLAAMRELERTYPKIVGWILDDRGQVRQHVNVFVNGEMTRGDAALAPDDRVHVLPSITGGAT